MSGVLRRVSNRGSYVDYPDGTTARVDSDRIWAIKRAMFSSAGPVPESMRQELRDAIQARTEELLALDTAAVTS